MTENFSNLMLDVKPQIQEPKGAPSRKNAKTTNKQAEKNIIPWRITQITENQK